MIYRYHRDDLKEDLVIKEVKLHDIKEALFAIGREIASIEHELVVSPPTTGPTASNSAEPNDRTELDPRHKQLFELKQQQAEYHDKRSDLLIRRGDIASLYQNVLD